MKYVPCSVQIDLEVGVCDRLHSGPTGVPFKPDTFISGDGGGKQLDQRLFVLISSYFSTCTYHDVSYLRG